MQHTEEQTDGIIPHARPAGWGHMTLATCFAIVAAIAAICALVVQIRRGYAAIPSYAAPVCPGVYAIPVVLLWIILGSLATLAWRRCSIDRLAYQVAISCVLVMSRTWFAAGLGLLGPGIYHDSLWPVACFGIFFVAPLLLRRFLRIGDPALVLADSSAVALLTYLVAVKPWIPLM
jgi:hypothetical protein